MLQIGKNKDINSLTVLENLERSQSFDSTDFAAGSVQNERNQNALGLGLEAKPSYLQGLQEPLADNVLERANQLIAHFAGLIENNLGDDAAAALLQGDQLQLKLDPSVDSLWSKIGEPETITSSRSLVVIDTTAKDWRELVVSAPETAEILILDANKDGLVQITEHLKQQRDNGALGFDHLAIISEGSEGSEGQFQLGNEKLGTTNLETYREVLSQWSLGLTPDAEINLYGSNTSKSADESTFAQELIALAHGGNKGDDIRSGRNKNDKKVEEIKQSEIRQGDENQDDWLAKLQTIDRIDTTKPTGEEPATIATNNISKAINGTLNPKTQANQPQIYATTIEDLLDKSKTEETATNRGQDDALGRVFGLTVPELQPTAETHPIDGESLAWIPENPTALVDGVQLQQSSNEYRANQIYLCSTDTSNFASAPFQSVNKLDAIAVQAAATNGVVLIDSTLITTIPTEELTGSLVISIDSNQDVINQITTALEDLYDIPVLRIISHGDIGVLKFGNQAIDSTDLTSNNRQIASWGKSLADDADILLYGCSIAGSDGGKAFVQLFASMTQADIGASSNITGTGGDVVLEFQVGKVSNTLMAGAIDYYRANLTLAQITVTTTSDYGAGSLRQAITDANHTSANDEIIFASSLFANGGSPITLGSDTLPKILPTATAGSLTIAGPGTSSLIISGNNGNSSRNFRIFYVDLGGNLSISGLTVSGAQTTETYGEGGGIINYGTLNISNSVITGNSVSGSSSYGGGIQNDSSAILNISNTTISGNNSANHAGGVNNKGTINITSSTISNNTAANAGGGFVNNINGNLLIINSTISGNTANNGSGGGIFNNTILNISNTTISNNAAVSGGGIFGNGGTINIANTIIANSTTGGDYAGSATVNVTSPSTAWTSAVLPVLPLRPASAHLNSLTRRQRLLLFL